LERRGEQLAGLGVEVDLELVGVGLAVLPGQLGLGVEQVHLAGPAVLEQADDGLCLGGVVRRLRGQRVGGTGLVRQELRQRQRADPARVAGEEGPAGQGEVNRVSRRHGAPHSTYRKALLARTIWHRSAQARSPPLSPAYTRRCLSRNRRQAERSSSSGGR